MFVQRMEFLEVSVIDCDKIYKKKLPDIPSHPHNETAASTMSMPRQITN